MERLTSNKPVDEMNMVELAYNACYAKDRLARYRDFEMDMDARDFARNLMTTLTDDELPLDDDNFDEEILENLMYDPFSNVKGLIALFYRNLWAMADLREKLKYYEDAEEQGLLPKFHLGDEFWTMWLGKPLKAKIVMLQQKKNGIWKYRFCDEQSHTHDYEENEFGKYFWTTKEEAEQALAERKNDE